MNETKREREREVYKAFVESGDRNREREAEEDMSEKLLLWQQTTRRV